MPGIGQSSCTEADVDDAAATALLDHLLRGELGAEEGALQIDGEHLLVLLLGRVENGCARLDAGVVDHDVHAAELLTAALMSFLQVGDLADVSVDADGLVAQRADLFLQRFGRLGMRDVVNDDVGALFASSSTMAMPMPLLPPVTMATLPFRLMIHLLCIADG